MTHPIVSVIRLMAELLVGDDELDAVRGVEGSQSLTIEVCPTTDRAASRLIGRGGVTADAFRHLAARAGRALTEPLQVTVVILDPPGRRR